MAILVMMALLVVFLFLCVSCFVLSERCDSIEKELEKYEGREDENIQRSPFLHTICPKCGDGSKKDLRYIQACEEKEESISAHCWVCGFETELELKLTPPSPPRSDAG